MNFGSIDFKLSQVFTERNFFYLRRNYRRMIAQFRSCSNYLCVGNFELERKLDMVYIPKYEAAKAIKEILVDINTAREQWLLYADFLTKAYILALKNQKAVFDAMKEDLLPSQMEKFIYSLTSLFTVAFGGGLIGGLMAPWVRQAGNEMGYMMKDLVERTTVSNASRAIGGSVIQDLTKEWTKVVSQKDLYAPVVTDAFEFNIDLRLQIGMYFSTLIEQIEQDMKLADTDFSNEGVPKQMGELKRDLWALAPGVNDNPTSNDMPDINEASRQAEIGMWVAWANTAFNYQNELKQMMYYKYERKPDHITRDDVRILIKKFVRVKDRLEELGVGYFTTDTVVNSKYSILSIPRLANLGEHLGGIFFGNISKITNSPQQARNTLTSLISVKPIYKRGNRGRLPVVRAGVTAVRK